LATLKHFEEISSLVVNPWEFSDPASIRIKHREDGHPDLRQSMAVLAVFIPPFAKARRMGHPSFCVCSKNRRVVYPVDRSAVWGESGFASLDNPPFAIRQQRMGHPDFVSADSVGILKVLDFRC
jgi:hypothetical protein